MRWKNNLSWLLFGLVAAFLGWYVLVAAKVQQAGDIAEYYGVTESMVNHGGVSLTQQDQTALEQVLHPAYFDMSGYYVTGRGGERYPVHFWVYSLMAVPFRMVLAFFHQDPRRSLLLVNWASITLAVFYVLKRYLKSPFYRVVLMAAVFSGAMMSFLTWPGPDLWYLSLLLVATFAFFGREYDKAAVLTALASWHSQPLMVMAVGLTAYYVYRKLRVTIKGKAYLHLSWQPVAAAVLVGLLVLVPYAYNYYAFGVLSPWTILQDGWTKLNGFGLQNMSLWKFYEQWFDLNIGLFWYAPLVFLLAVVGVWRLRKYDGRLLYFVGLTLLTAFFYQTNPAWHYGTVGYGPGRHGVFLLPVLIFFAVRALKPKVSGWLLTITLLGTQIGGLSLNGYLEPDFTNTLVQSPYAQFVLARWPAAYNPTPEIFMDRTNHTDLDYPTTAVYTVEGKCVKAYVLLSDKDKVADECGGIPKTYEQAFDDSLSLEANYSRKVVSKEITLWPDPDACADWFTATAEKPFVCLRSVQDVVAQTGLADVSRLTTLDNYPYPGIWKINWGDPVTITVPPGYVVNYYALNGVYVTFPTR